jgi:hypothetical protein
MKKASILFFIVIITIALVYLLTQYLPPQGFAFAWALNFLLMACALSFTETLKGRLNSSYYNEKTWERRGKIYESFGINFFRKLLVLVGWEKLNKKSNPVKTNTSALLQLHYRTKQSELGHVIIFIIVLGFNIFVAFQYGVMKSLWLLLLNIVFNLYPISLQRYNRPRLERAVSLSRQRTPRI